MPFKEPVDTDLAKLRASAGPYPLEALYFVQTGFSHASKSLLKKHNHGHQDGTNQLSQDDRHLSGQQLCFGLLEFAIDQYGMLAPVVLRHWNVQRTDDFGRIVFALIDIGVFRKSPSDSIDDFRSVYDFGEVFSRDVLRRKILESRG
ncbi:MAG: hypothetical protein EXS17_00750 [Phycisphaerales bacterium]|nr:hypothetical protein [Phycisphaerales bacterium]